MNDEYHNFMSNREAAHQPKLGLGWCFGCDRYMVAWGAKCPVCKTRNGDKRLKKG